MDGVSPEAPGYDATPTYVSNTATDEGYGLENLNDLQVGTAWINIQSFSVTVTVTIPKTKVTKYQLGA